MRRFARVAIICCVCGLCSVMYTVTQIVMSLEPRSRLEGHDKITKQLKRDASLLLPSFPKVETVEGLEQEQRWLQPRCEKRSLSFWNPYWMLPSGVCGMNCFWESAFRYETNKTDVKRSPDKWIHLAVVACGERYEETVTMLKSSILFNLKPIQFHIFAEDELHPKFKNTLNSWPFQQKFHYILYPITFPSENAAEWKKLFKPCASQRLFLPLVLKDVDALLYVDTDILFLRPVDDIWSFFKYFNSTQIAAMAPEHEEPRIGWYNRFARHPYYGSTGVNSGVMLMNMTRIRRKYFKNDMTTARLQWGEMLMPLLKKYKFNITWGDQDLLNIIFYHNPESLFVFPCQWNYRPDHCIYGSNCKESEEEGIFILHGNRGVYHDNKQPAFRAVYEAIHNYTFGDDHFHALLYPLKKELRETTHTYCGKLYKIFLKQLKKSIEGIPPNQTRRR